MQGGADDSVREIVTTVPSRSSRSVSRNASRTGPPFTTFNPIRPASDQDARGLAQHTLVLFLGLEESERMHQDGSGDAAGSKRQSPHVASDPACVNAKVGTQTLRSHQQGDREVDASDFSSALRHCERVPPMATADINDPGTRRKVEKIPKAARFQPNMTTSRKEATLRLRIAFFPPILDRPTNRGVMP
jgi:hypothetical protein